MDKKPAKRDSERWNRLMYWDVPRWIRVYDSGNSGERYTVVYSNLKIRTANVSWHPYRGMSGSPFHPQGVGISGESQYGPIDVPTYSHLGRKVVFADLPLDCQWLVLQDYCDYWDLNLSTHPMAERIVEGSWSVSWQSGAKPWRAPRPPRGKFDSREWMGYFKEQCQIERHVLFDLLALTSIGTTLEQLGVTFTPDSISAWDVRDRQEAHAWATATYLAANDNTGIKVPKVPDIFGRMFLEQNIGPVSDLRLVESLGVEL